MIAATIAIAVILGIATVAFCVHVWKTTLESMDIDMSDWDKRAFDDFYGDIGRISHRD